MMKFFFFLSLFYCLSLGVWAQEITLQGVVVDAKTQASLPSVGIVVEGGGIGVATNADGRFVCSIPTHLHQNDLLVTLMGYQLYRIKISQITNPQAMRILLEEVSQDLSEVSLKGLSAKQVVALAYEKIPENYPLTPTLYTGFYRESNYHYKINEADAKCYYFIEAVIKLNKPSYKHRLPEGDIKIVEVRKNKMVSDTTKFTKWISGAFTPTRFDVAKKRFDFITPTHLDRYKFEITDFTTYYGRQVYVIHFTPAKSSAEHEGVLYIDTETFAIIKVDYKFSPKGLNLENIGRGGNDLSERLFRTNYQPIGNKWYIQSIWQQAKAKDTKAVDSVKYMTEYAVTRIDTNTHEKFEYGDKIQWEDVFLLKSVPYKADFWKNYHVIIPTESEEKLLIDTQIKTKEIANIDTKDSTKKYSKRKKRISYWLSVNPRWVQSNIAVLNLAYQSTTNSFSLDESTTLRTNMLAFSVTSGYEVYLLKGVSATLQTAIGMGGFKNAGFQIGLDGAWNMSKPKKRPLYITCGVHYAALSLLKKIRDVDNIEDTRIALNGTTFESKRVRINVGKQQKGITASIGLELELNRNNFLFFNMGYFVSNTQKEGLYFIGKGVGFFKKPQKIWIDVQDANFTMQADGKTVKSVPFQANLLANIGFRSKFSK